MEYISRQTSRKILLLLAKHPENYSKIVGGGLTVTDCEAKVANGINICFFPAFMEKAYLANHWKNGDTKTLRYTEWNDTLCVTFKISKTVGISGMRMASFTLINVDIECKDG